MSIEMTVSLRLSLSSVALGLLFSCGAAVAAPRNEDLETIREAVKFNETAVATYRFDAVFDSVSYVTYGKDFVIEGVRVESGSVIRHTCSLTVDNRGGGLDFLLRYRLPAPGSQLSQIPVQNIRQKNAEGILESVAYDENSRPINGQINLSSLSNYFRLYEDPFIWRTSVLWPDENSSAGFQRVALSEFLESDSPERVYLDPRGFAVDGHDCRRLVFVRSVAFGKKPNEAQRIVEVIVYLGIDLNYAIVKCSSFFMVTDETLDRPLLPERGQSVESWGIPSAYVLNKEFHRLDNGIWLPCRVERYALSDPRGKFHVSPGDDGSTLSKENLAIVKEANAHLPEMKNRRDVIVVGMNSFEVVPESVEINFPIDRKVFRESIIPKGVPVYDFVMGVFPDTLKQEVQAVPEKPVVKANAEAKPESDRRDAPQAENAPRSAPQTPTATDLRRGETTRSRTLVVLGVALSGCVLLLALAFVMRRFHR